ncbi:MAG: histidine kinase N-terminal 7TM domain-containing protein [Halorientalis sp.]
MGLQFTLDAVPYLVSAVVVTAVATQLWRNRERRGAKPFLIDLTGIVLLSVFDAMLVLSTDLAGKQFWWNWRFVAISFMGIGYLFMAIEYTNREHWITYRVGAGVVAIPAISQFLVWTNDSHGLFYGTALDPVTNRLTVTFGPFYWLLAVVIVAYLGVGIWLLLRLSRRQTAYLRQTAIIVGGITLVLVGQLLWWLHLVPIDPLPLTSLVKSTAFLFGVARFELLDIVPVARNKVIENMRDAVFVVDRTNRIVDVNAAGKRLVDHPDPVRESIDDVFDTDTFAGFVDTTDTQTEITLESDEESRHYDFRVSPLYDDQGAQSGRLFVFRDITRLKRREEELSILNRIVRHDINNDMTVIRGRSELLAEHVEEDGRPHLDAIRESSEHVVELTENVRDLMTSITGEESIELDRIDLVAVLETQLRQARQRYGDAEFVIEADLPDGCFVEANEMLSSVFTNLFNNAVQHNDGPCRVTVTVEQRESSVRVEVADDGSGVPESKRDEIFGRGHKGLDSSGTGVGLYLVDTLVDHYGGQITIEESDAGGAAFIIELPLPAQSASSETEVPTEN